MIRREETIGSIFQSLKNITGTGERYYFKKQIDNSGPFEFEDKCYIASIEVIPYLYQCSDTTLIPENIRKKEDYSED